MPNEVCKSGLLSALISSDIWIGHGIFNTLAVKNVKIRACISNWTDLKLDCDITDGDLNANSNDKVNRGAINRQ
jgi:hypothetical protein